MRLAIFRQKEVNDNLLLRKHSRKTLNKLQFLGSVGLQEWEQGFVAGGQSSNWVTIPAIPQPTLTTISILPVASLQVLPQNQESLATNQDSSMNKINAVNSVAKSTENVLTRFIEVLSKNLELNLDFTLVCKRIGLKWKWKAE